MAPLPQATLRTPLDPRHHASKIEVYHLRTYFLAAGGRMQTPFYGMGADYLFQLVLGHVEPPPSLWNDGGYVLAATITPDRPVQVDEALGYAFAATNSVSAPWHGQMVEDLLPKDGRSFDGPLRGLVVHAPHPSPDMSYAEARTALLDVYRNTTTGDVLVLYLHGGYRVAFAAGATCWFELGVLNDTDAWPTPDVMPNFIYPLTKDEVAWIHSTPHTLPASNEMWTAVKSSVLAAGRNVDPIEAINRGYTAYFGDHPVSARSRVGQFAVAVHRKTWYNEVMMGQEK